MGVANALDQVGGSVQLVPQACPCPLLHNPSAMRCEQALPLHVQCMLDGLGLCGLQSIRGQTLWSSCPLCVYRCTKMTNKLMYLGTDWIRCFGGGSPGAVLPLLTGGRPPGGYDGQPQMHHRREGLLVRPVLQCPVQEAEQAAGKGLHIHMYTHTDIYIYPYIPHVSHKGAGPQLQTMWFTRS